MKVYKYKWSNNVVEKFGYVTGRNSAMAEQKILNKYGDGEIEITHFMDENEFKDLIDRGSCEINI